ncbi:MAG: AAA family ATPase [Xanthomonadales bacterium]|nr:AAA family ATPase [Xanthomonadales bacterium]
MSVHRYIIFGNSGSGKSTRAKELKQELNLAHLDLDTLAWLPTNPPSRKPLEESEQAIDVFINTHKNWVIEGCYSDLLAYAAEYANQAIFMNLPVSLCQSNARNRPWEPHKYESKAAQDANLDMLLNWIADYPNREDEFSLQAHLSLYNQFPHTKKMIIKNENPTRF